MSPHQTDVLVVGAGPTGLALATALQKAGVSHLLVEASQQAHSTSRAAVVHAHTLEMLDGVDIVAPLASQALKLSRFTIRDRDQALLELRFDDLPSPYRHLLMVPQSTTEAVLQGRLTGLGGRIHRGVSALSAVAEPGGAAVRVASAAGEQTVHARYVVAGDGMHSAVREAAGIAFPGEAYGESFVLADVTMDWPLGAREVSLFFSPAGLVVVAPLPGGSFRVVATLENAPEQPGIEVIQQLLDARGPTAACRVTGINWASRFRVHHRLANSYRSGPFLLMGDAAHVHSPAGGQGMNTGLVDAMVLAEALIRVVRGGEPDSLLDDYARLRRPAAQKVLVLASRMTHLATLRTAGGRRVRNLLLRLLNRLAPFKSNLALALSGLNRREASQLPAARRAETRRPQAEPIARLAPL